MIVHSILTHIIDAEFMKNVGKFQVNHKREGKDAPEAMLLCFNLPTAMDEEGYRHVEIAIYAAMNYVSVFTRERWDVISSDDMDYGLDGEGDPQIKPGRGYTKGEDAWTRVAHHDSAWREGLDRIFEKYGKKLGGPSPRNVAHDSWYEVVDPNALGLTF